MNMIKIFKDKLGDPVDANSLLEYLDFCTNSNNLVTGEYCENHHICPQSLFSEISSPKNNKWNITRLLYKDHVTAHYLLLKAYPIRSFSAPLNFMKCFSVSEKENLTKFLSEISKREWEDRKNNPEQMKIWSIKRSVWMTENQKEDKEFKESVKAGLLLHYRNNPEAKDDKRKEKQEWWDSLSDAEYIKFCGKMKDLWTPERLVLHEKQLTYRYSDKEFMVEFTNKMKMVNSNIVKRSKNSETSKENWKDDEFRHNILLKRQDAIDKKRMDGKLKTNSSSMKEKWADSIWRENMLNKRKVAKNETK